MRALGAVAGVSLVLGLVACGPPPPVHLEANTRTYRADDYDRVFDAWTRHTQVLVLQGVDDRITATATYYSWDFRSAYVARYAQDATLTEDGRQQMLATSLARLQTDHEFYVATETMNTRWGELNRSFSAFRVVLVDDHGREVAPSRIEPVRRLTAADRTYFPYSSPWRQHFHIHFPARAMDHGTEFQVLGPGTRYFILRFGGALGTADLRWDVASPG